MSECPTYEVLRQYQARELAVAEVALVEEHLRDCAACRAWLAVDRTVTPSPRPAPGESSDVESPGRGRGLRAGVGPSDRSWDMVAPGARFAIGQVIAGRYRVERFLAGGGMGEVWLVHDSILDAPRALKIILGKLDREPTSVARFRHEAKVMARLNNPHSVVIHDAELSDDQLPYIVMEYVEGKSLDKLLRKGQPMPLAWTARLLDQLCDLLHAAHGQKPPVIHRDLKPSNMMLLDGRREGYEHLKVLDFGLAKTLATDGGPSEVSGPTLKLIGTPAYMSPEQFLGGPVDARSDLYTVGVILYEFLAGRRPFVGNVNELMEKHLSQPPPPFRESNPAVSVPLAVEALVMRCLAKSPELRPQSSRELAEAFRSAAWPSTETAPAWYRGTIVAAVLSLLVVSVGIGMAIRSGSRRGADQGNGPTVAVPSTPTATRPDEQTALSAGPDKVLRAIARDIQAVPVGDRPMVRYFSLRHLADEGAGEDVLAVHRAALAAAVNSVSRAKKPVRLVAIDPERTIYRINIRTALWHETPFSEGEADEPSPVNLFDLVLLEYPYGVVPARTDEFEAVATDFLRPAAQVRPVPYVRADWFVANATRPPLYRDLLRLPLEIGRLKAWLGPDSGPEAVPITSAVASPPAGTPHAPHLERQATRGGALWKTFRSPPGDVIFTLANGLSGFARVDSRGMLAMTGIVDLGPTKLRGGLDCLACHAAGLEPADAGGTLNAALSDDRERHARALAAVLGVAPSGSLPPEPIGPVARRYLDEPVTCRRAAAELGLSDPAALRTVVGLPIYAELGLAPLAAGRSVDRGSWEKAFPSIVRRLGLGAPIVPIDSLSRAPGRSDQGDAALGLASNHENDQFAPKEAMSFLVTNRSGHDLRVELVATDEFGRMTVPLPAPVTIGAGGIYHYPPEGGIEIQLGAAFERVTAYGSTGNTPPGVRLSTRRDDVGDRFLHRVRQPGYDARAEVGPPEVLKATVVIETVDPSGGERN